jgi:hypothetical protein
MHKCNIEIISLQDILYTGEDVGNNSFYVYCGDGDFPASFWDGPGKNCTNNKVDNKQSCCDKASLAYSWIEEGSAMVCYFLSSHPFFDCFNDCETWSDQIRNCPLS